MNKEQTISSFITALSKQVMDGDDEDVLRQLNGFVADHPDWIDDRFKAELTLLTDLMEERRITDEWAYFRGIRYAYSYCLNNYGKEAPTAIQPESSLLPQKDTIWWCWLQGYEQAPDIVKACYRSLEKLQKPVVILTDGNISDYITLPEWILRKYREGIIDRTHYSDLVRIELLTTLGGTWIDSTAFCTGTSLIKPLLESADLFLFSFVMRDSVSRYLLFDNWFMHAVRKNIILEDTKNMLYTYWKNENDLKHYFIFHILFSIACRKHPEERAAIPIYSNEPCHVLQRELFNPFTENRRDQIVGMSDIHKLTYKIDKEKEIPDGCFWAQIIQNGL
ncbi:MAG: capsular polysaccharide synthesis protein [Lachnospiraceae bacterium]|nr:capsular polysaccharide synthesis protein [Lachnospiraceae bacterium]